MINLIIILGLCLGAHNVVGDGVESRLAGGQSVTSLASNYQCAVLGPVNMCSGSLVRADSVLTSAACISGVTPSELEVRVGSTQYWTGGIDTVGKYVNTHPKYNAATYDFNVGVITIPALDAGLMTSMSIAVIPLATGLLSDNSPATLIGYGGLTTQNQLPDYLQVINIIKFSSTICTKLWGAAFLQPEMICAGDPNGVEDACTADDGGAFVNKGIQYGIYSHGGKCATSTPTAPVFVNVAPIRNWVMFILANFAG